MLAQAAEQIEGALYAIMTGMKHFKRLVESRSRWYKQEVLRHSNIHFFLGAALMTNPVGVYEWGIHCAVMPDVASTHDLRQA